MSSLFQRPEDDERAAKAKVAFDQLKPICVPLMGISLLTPSKTPQALELLTRLHSKLRDLQESLTPSLIQYVFFPISSILRRNDVHVIPDQVFERIFLVLEALCEAWWWTCEVEVWSQLFLLAGSVLLPPSAPGKPGYKVRDDHAKEAACRCIWQLTRPRSSDEEEAAQEVVPTANAEERLELFRNAAISTKSFPILGQMVTNLLTCSLSPHRPLQLVSLQVLRVLIVSYMRESHAPNVLPGVVSSMCKILIAPQPGRSWQSGEVTREALKLLEAVVVVSIGDSPCIEAELVRKDVTGIEELEDLVTTIEEEAGTPSASAPFLFTRTRAWFEATASQLFIAINSLTPLLTHPNPTALLAFSDTSSAILSATFLTLPRVHPLLLSNLLTLSLSTFPAVSQPTRSSLLSILLSYPKLLRTLLEMTTQNLTALSRLIPSHSDTKVQHLASQIEAVCLLAETPSTSAIQISHGISQGIAALLGPSGGIEKWGSTLLNVLQFTTPTVVITGQASSLFLESSSDPSSSLLAQVYFPPLELAGISSQETLVNLEKMLRALGRAGGEECLFAVEWFVERGRRAASSVNVAALWSASRLLEGIGGVVLGGEDNFETPVRSRRLEKIAQWIVRSVAERLEGLDDEDWGEEERNDEEKESDALIVDYKKGVTPLTTLLDINVSTESSSTSTRRNLEAQGHVHTAVLLHLLTISASILASKFRPLLLHALYPLLRALVDAPMNSSTAPSTPLVSSTAHNALLSITHSTAYASPSNMLLANFDYVLDAVSLHLTRSRLDVHATKVLVILVRLVGGEVVDRAGDVVEECFDRLDEYHGYGVIVEGLVEVLGEVVRVVQADVEARGQVDGGEKGTGEAMRQGREGPFGSFLNWYAHRADPDPLGSADDFKENFGPVPQRAWGPTGDEKEDKEADTTAPNPSEEDKPTALQSLIQQIISRSLFFLTHPSAYIRSRILSLLTSSVPVLRSTTSSLLPTIHKAWPLILNRLSDSEPFVLADAAGLVAALVTHVGDFMTRKVMDDVWPRFQKILLSSSPAAAATTTTTTSLSRPSEGSSSSSYYTTTTRLYRSILHTLVAIVKSAEMDVPERFAWEIALACRRFLSAEFGRVHLGVEEVVREVYVGLGRKGYSDLVWLVLCGMVGRDPLRVSDQGNKDEKKGDKEVRFPRHLLEKEWDVREGVLDVLNAVA